MPRPRTAALALAAALVLALPVLADGDVRVEVRGSEGGSLRVQIPGSWARAFLAAVDVECEPADDPAMVRAIRALEREGDGGSVRFVDRDGDRIHATLKDDLLRLDVHDPDDGEEARIELPWRAAECWVLGRRPEGGVALGERESDFRFDLESDDARIHVAID